MIIDDDFSLDDDEDDDLPGYPLYPASEDVFSKGLIEEDIDPEDISKIKKELGQTPTTGMKKISMKT